MSGGDEGYIPNAKVAKCVINISNKLFEMSITHHCDVKDGAETTCVVQ
jgi:hypothetical protein